MSADYRLAPEHPYPAALRDVTAAYRALAGQADGAGHVVVSGESAGGNLAIELLISGKEEGLTMPAAALLLSPMTDLTVTGSSYAGKAHADPAISAQAIRTRAADYLAGTDTDQRRIRRAMADLCRITSWETPIRLILLPLMRPPDVGSRRTGKSCVVIAG